MKHLEVRQKYSAVSRIFNSLLGFSPCDETLHLMLDIIVRSWPLLDGILSLKNCRFFAFCCELPGRIYVYFVNYKGK